MSMLIKSAEMPEACCTCPCSYDNQCAVNLKYPTFEEYHGSRPVWCPLVEVPVPHGRLIDADALIKDGWKLYKVVKRRGAYAIHEMSLDYPDIPTIMPEEKE